MFDLPLITSDSHFDVPPQLADKLPPEHRSKVTHLEDREDGVYLMPPKRAGAMAMASDAPSLEARARRARGLKVDPNDEVTLATIVGGITCAGARPGFSVQQRLSEMERDGIRAEVLIDNNSFVVTMDDPKVEAMWARIVNDWIVDTFEDHYDRFAPAMRLPILDPLETAKEIERGASRGLRLAMLPNNIPGENYHDFKWEPVWDAAERRNVRFVFHIAQLPNYGLNVAHLTGVHQTVMQYMFSSTMETLGSLINSGVFLRHPNLKVAMIESDAGYLEWFMQSADYFQKSRYAEFHEGHGMKIPKDLAPPSYYIRNNVKASFIYDPVAIARRKEIGMDVLLWGNDYPHPEGIFPNSREVLAKQFEGVPRNEVKKIVHDNAAEFFGFPV